MRVLRIIGIVVSLCVLGLSASAYAQEASVIGTVVDDSKAVLPGVTVTATSLETGVQTVAVSNGRGEYRLRLPPGAYKLLAEMSGFGPVLLGHAYEVVDNAAIERIRKGFCFDLSQEIQNELAEKVIKMIPCAEKVIFVLSGSDATTAAIRLAGLPRAGSTSPASRRRDRASRRRSC